MFAITLFLGYSSVAKVEALETKTIYSVNNNGTLASANSYNYGYLTGGGTQGSSRANVNTTVSGVAYGFNFQFYENVVLNKTYTLVINFMDIDLLKTFNSSMVQISTCNSTTCNENTLVSVVKSNNNGNSNKLTIEFNPITTGPIILVNLGSDQPITGVSTFGIKSVTLDSTNQNQEIIDNQTNNTNNIINNNNSNTQDIIDNQNSNASAIQDTINSNFQDCHTSVNLFNLTGITNTAVGSYSNGSVILNWNSGYNLYLLTNGEQYLTNLDNSKTYTISFKHKGNTIKFFDTVSNISINTNNDLDFVFYSFTVNNTDQIRLNINRRDTSGSAIIKEIQVQEGSTATDYEPYGQQICTNKLDEQTKTSKGILGKLGDLLDYFNPLSENWFVRKLVDLLIDGLKSLFVPDQEELTDLIDSFKATMETKLGAIYQVADLLVSVVRSVLDPASSNSCMTFPEIKDPMFDKLLIEQTDYCFDSLRTDFGFVFTLSDMIISIVCTLAFANMLYKKYEAFIGGNSNDY